MRKPTKKSRVEKIKPGEPLEFKNLFRRFPLDYNPSRSDVGGIPGWYSETIRKMVDKKYLNAVEKCLNGNTCGIDPENAKIVNYYYDVTNAIDYVLNRKNFLWD